MSTIRIRTNFNIDLSFGAAPFHRRLFAWILDIVVIIFYIFVVFRFIESLVRSGVFADDSDEGVWALIMFLFLPALTYHLICELIMNGQSVGKRLMGLRVVTENGGRPAISQYIIRWLIRTSDYMVILILLYAPTMSGVNLGFFWQIAAAFALLITDIILVNTSKKHQRLGDMLAHTLLIRTGEKADIHDTIFTQVKENYRPVFPQIMQLSDRDINALKSILDTAKKHQDYNLAERAADKIKVHLHIHSDMSPFDFLDTLLKDYNYLAAN
jgi:uncharacterized RDD family membrane protein YckC